VPKKNLLLVDADPRSLRVLEISLRKAGYNVAAGPDAKSALEMLDLSRPDLILSDTRLPGMDGFAMVEEIRRNPEWGDIPIIFLSSDVSVESKVHGLERGVEDYLTKPIYIKEIIARVNLVLQRKQRAGLEERTGAGKTKFTGSLADMGLVDLLQTIDNSKKSGVLYVTSTGQRAVIYFREGNAVDAELGTLRGERAVYRTLLWSEGTFEIDFRDVRREDVIQTSTQGVLMEGMRRLDEWGRLLEQMPHLESVFEVNDEELLRRLAELPDEINKVLKHFDGKRSVLQIIDRCDQDDLETLTVLSKLYFEGLIFDTGRRVDGNASASNGADSDPSALAGIATSSGLTMAPPSTGLTMTPPPAEHADAPTVVPAPDIERPQGPRTVPGVPKTSMPMEPTITMPGLEEARRTLDYGPVPDSGARRMQATRGRGRRLRRLQAGTERTLRGLQDPPVESSVALIADTAGAPEAEAKVQPAAALDPQEPATTQDEIPVTRSRRKRRRHKRLSLVTSPGMLTGIDPREEEEQSAASVDRPSSPHAEHEHRDAPLLDSDALVTEPPPSPPSVPQGRRSSDELPVRVSQMQMVTYRDPIVGVIKGEPESSAERSRRARTLREMRAVPPPQPEPPAVVLGSHTHPVAKVAPAREPRAVRTPAPSPERSALSVKSDPPAQREEREPISTVPPSDGTMAIPGTNRLVPLALLAAAIVIVGALLYRLTASDSPAPQPRTDAQHARPAQTQPNAPEPAKPPPAEPPPAEPTAAAQEPAAATQEPAPAAPEQVPAQAPSQAEPAPGEPAAAPSDEVAARAHELVQQARVLEQQGKPRQALQLYEEAAGLVPNDAEILGRLAFGLLNRGENEQASDYAARAVAVDPTNSEGWIVLGAARYALGDKNGAKDAYRKCVEIGRGPYVEECRKVAR